MSKFKDRLNQAMENARKEDTKAEITGEDMVKSLGLEKKSKSILNSIISSFISLWSKTKVKEEKSDHNQKEPIFGTETKTYVGINNDLIEQEILSRVDFKMSEFNTSLTNIAKRIKEGAFVNPAQTREAFTSQLELSNAIKLIQERFDKERYMGGPRDGLFYQKMVTDKNKLVDSVTQTILDRTDREYPRKASKINDLIEQHIYKNNI